MNGGATHQLGYQTVCFAYPSAHKRFNWTAGLTATDIKQPDQIAQGVVIILVSVAAMALADAMVKLVSSNLSVWQVFVARSLFAVPCLLTLGYITSTPLQAVFKRWVLLRSALLVLTWLVFYASLPVLKLSVAAVAVYTNPILTALLSALVLGERVSKHQWLGVVIGFAGIAAILRPGSDVTPG